MTAQNDFACKAVKVFWNCQGLIINWLLRYKNLQTINVYLMIPLPCDES